MCWNIKEKKSKVINSDYNIISSILIQMLHFKKLKSISAAVSYKNRFLIYKRSSKLQFIGLFVNKGNKLKVVKLVNNVYLQFLHGFHLLCIKQPHLNFFSKSKLNMGEFINLYNSFLLFKD